MIQIKEIRYCNSGFIRVFDKDEQRQIARKIEKFLLKQSILCEVNVK